MAHRLHVKSYSYAYVKSQMFGADTVFWKPDGFKSKQFQVKITRLLVGGVLLITQRDVGDRVIDAVLLKPGQHLLFHGRKMMASNSPYKAPEVAR